MATVKGGLQCAKAFNGFMSSCDLGPDSWGGNADILSVVKLKMSFWILERFVNSHSIIQSFCSFFPPKCYSIHEMLFVNKVRSEMTCDATFSANSHPVCECSPASVKDRNERPKRRVAMGSCLPKRQDRQANVMMATHLPRPAEVGFLSCPWGESWMMNLHELVNYHESCHNHGKNIILMVFTRKDGDFSMAAIIVYPRVFQF